MTPQQWAEVFRAGHEALPLTDLPPGNCLLIALAAMEVKARQIAEDTA